MSKSPAQINLAKLPGSCATTNSVTGKAIIIRAGEMGYHEAPTLHDQAGQPDYDDYNRAVGANKAHIAAMTAGSMCGWETLGADPDLYDPETGRLKKAVPA